MTVLGTILDYISKTAPAIIGIVALYFTNKNNMMSLENNKKILAEKKNEEARKEIYKKLNSFYGPILHLRGMSQNFYEILRQIQPIINSTSTIEYLLSGVVLSGNEQAIVEAIVNISEEVNDIIIKYSGLIDDPFLREKVSYFGTHSRVLSLIFEKKLNSNSTILTDYTFPASLDEDLEKEVQRLKEELRILNL